MATNEAVSVDSVKSDFRLAQFAVLLPLAASSAFVITVAHIFGELVGAGSLSLARFITFSDYVNLAVPTAAGLLVVSFLSFLTVGLLVPHVIERAFIVARRGMGAQQDSEETEPWNMPKIIRVGLAVAVLVATVVLFLKTGFLSVRTVALQTGAIFIMVGALALMSFVGRPYLPARTLGIATVILFAVLLGGLSGFWNSTDDEGCTVRVTVDGKLLGQPIRLYALDKGLALVGGGQVQLLRWDAVKHLDMMTVPFPQSRCDRAGSLRHL